MWIAYIKVVLLTSFILFIGWLIMGLFFKVVKQITHVKFTATNHAEYSIPFSLVFEMLVYHVMKKDKITYEESQKQMAKLVQQQPSEIVRFCKMLELNVYQLERGLGQRQQRSGSTLNQEFSQIELIYQN
jgi:hypothetical protein